MLAAGQSRRFGSDKRLQPIAGVPLAGLVVRQLQSLLAQVVVVVRSSTDPLLSQLALADQAAQPVDIAISPAPERGMGLSIASGVQAAPAAKGWLIALADMPIISSQTIQAVADELLRHLKSAPRVAVVPCHNGRSGHPVAFSGGCRRALVALDGDVGAKALLRDPSTLVRWLDVDDPGVLLDVDRPQDLLEVQHAWRGVSGVRGEVDHDG